MGYYFTYPSEDQHLGMVSTISDDPPMLNWIFVDKDTLMVRHGGRMDTLGGHTIGPWYWTNDERWLTLKGDAAHFVAVEMENKKWAIAWDRDGHFSADLGTEEDESEEGETDEEENGSQDKEDGGGRKKRPRWVPVLLQRKPQLGMESRYVKGANG